MRKTDETTNQTPFLSRFIAPWALPREEIPIHLVWEPRLTYDSIHIHLSPPLEVKEFFNVESYEKKGSDIVISKLRTPNFLGFVVIANEISNEQHVKKQITVNFVLQGKAQHSHVFTANIFRPRLSVTQKPESIVLSDESDLNRLVNISLKISGFGRIEVDCQASTGGQFESNPEPLYRELVRRVLSTFRLSKTEPDKKKEIEINPQYIVRMTKEFVEKMKKGELPLEIEASDLDDFKKWFGEHEAQAQLTELVSKQLENLLIDSLLFYLERYPTDGVELASGKPTTLIERATQNMSIRFQYRDSLGNKYEPEPVNIPIKDLRTDKKKRIELPINIRWIHEPLNPEMEGAECE